MLVDASTLTPIPHCKPHRNRMLACSAPNKLVYHSLTHSFCSSYIPASPKTPWIQPIKLKVSGMYRLPSQSRWECAEPVVLGRKPSLSKVGLQRWIFHRMRVSYLSDIELRTPARRKLVARQYYVQFSVGDTSRSTNSAKEA
jgi:hypothetical protein